MLVLTKYGRAEETVDIKQAIRPWSSETHQGAVAQMSCHSCHGYLEMSVELSCH